MKDIVGGMSISGGIGLPVLGSSGTIDIVYGATGHALNGGLYTESLTADDGSAMSYFVDFGYAFGIHEALFGLRNVKTEGSATVSTTKGICKVTGKDKFESSGSSMSYLLGYATSSNVLNFKGFGGGVKSLWPFFPPFSASSQRFQYST